MERTVNFNRDRRMRCERCDHAWTVDLAWIERWHQGDEACPGCDTACEAEHGARVTVSEDDPVLEDCAATQLAWYHTSTYADWPPTIDFAASLGDNVRRSMGGDDVVARWAHRQSTRALHIGTYESAIHNMLRRIKNQGDTGKQFYLYRIYLKPEVVIQPGWITDPSNFVGDFHLDELCSPEVEAVRYANDHEDPGGLSLAIRPSAIGTTQRLAIPLATGDDDPWIVDAVARLSTDPPDVPLPVESRRYRDVFGRSPRAETAATAANMLVNLLPTNLRYQFEAAARWHTESEPVDWARYTVGLAALIEDSARVLTELDAQAERRH